MLSFADFINALTPTNKGFLICKFLKDLVVGFSIENVIFRDLQSMDGLCLSNQERPRITGFEGVLMMLKTIWLLWSVSATSIGFVSWVTLPEDKGRPSITSTWTGLDFSIRGIL